MEGVVHSSNFFLVFRECYFATCCAALNPTVSNFRAWTS